MRRNQVGVGLAALGSVVVLLVFAFPADVRPPGIRGHEDDPDRVARGQQIVRRGIEAQGGLEAWSGRETLDFTILDEWDSTLFRLYMPLAENTVRLAGTMQLHNWGRRSAWEVMTGAHEGRRFGVEDGRAWNRELDRPGGIGVRFYAPTMQYLATLAFRVREGHVISWIDSVEREGVAYDRVLITWDDPTKPTYSLDQYVLYYRRSDGLLTDMECTVRDFAPFITGAVEYRSWSTVDGITLPSEYAMRLFDLDGPQVHVVTLSDIAFDASGGGIGEAGHDAAPPEDP